MFWLLIALSETAVRFVGRGAPDGKQRVIYIDGRGVLEPMERGPVRRGPLEWNHKSWM